LENIPSSLLSARDSSDNVVLVIKVRVKLPLHLAKHHAMKTYRLFN